MLGLMSLAALNMSQAMVLCLGADGHIAVEPVGHHHCADGSRTHEHAAAGWQAGDHSHVGSDPCGSCIDIPFPDGASDVSQRPKLAAAAAVVSLSAIHEPSALDAVGATSSLSRLFCCSSSLRSTILQV